MTVPASLALLAMRKARTVRNGLGAMAGWDWAKAVLFSLAGLGMLVGLHLGFVRVLRYLETIELLGGLLTWKLTGMALLTTFWMVAISNLIAAVSTLYFAHDLGFLMASPMPPRAVFLDKAVESSVYASWMVLLALVPYILALARVKAQGWAFVAAFVGLSVPFLAMAAAIGVLLTMTLLYLFPTARTRDAVWIFSSAAMAVTYVVIRFAEPERLIRPDALERVAQYLQYLQAPTAPYFPSWWLTECLLGFSVGNRALVLKNLVLLAGGAGATYALMAALADRMYLRGVAGAQEGGRTGRAWRVGPSPEGRLRAALGLSTLVPFLYWKDRKLFVRDVKHWSQLMLILALIVVYLFSIWRLPLDTPHLKSLTAFLNIGMAGFVLAALSLRFTFPAVSLEGRSLWVVRSAPLGVRALMTGKFVFSVVPMMALGGGIVALTNGLLEADRFLSWLTFGSMLLICWTLCGMGVGFGAIFPKFRIENIHQIESSAGGFAYMACALGYIGATMAVEAWVVQNHFAIKFGQLPGWDPRIVSWTVGTLACLNLLAFALPWLIGQRMLESNEDEG